MFQAIRTSSSHPDFLKLIQLLDQELAIRDGDDHSFYHQFNGVEAIHHVLLIYKDSVAVGCGALKAYAPTTMEIKRVYTTPESRGKGVASLLLKELEKWAKELDTQFCILETGFNQPEAIGLYKKLHYEVIPNYGPYAGLDTSICFRKNL